MSKTHNLEPSLCWDCALATRPWRCPWVSKEEPVEGWKANPTTIAKKSRHPYHSQLVVACPKFERDSFCGGVLADDENEHVFPNIDSDDVKNLAEATVERGIIDWNALERGKLKSIKFDGQFVYRAEVLRFFFSPWISELMASFTKRTPEWLRQQLGMTEDRLESLGVYRAEYR